MEQSAEIAVRNGATGSHAKKTPRWAWPSMARATNTCTLDQSLAPDPISAPVNQKEHHKATSLSLDAPTSQSIAHGSPEGPLNATGSKDQPMQPHSCSVEVLASAPKSYRARKSSTAYSKGPQDEPGVRINIIVDPDSGETIGTVTLLENTSSGFNGLDAIEGSDSVLDEPRASPTTLEGKCANPEQHEAGDHFSGLLPGEGVEPYLDPSQPCLLNGEEATPADALSSASNEPPRPLPEDLYSGMTPREAEAEQKRLESWIAWAIVTDRDPAFWRQRRAVARKRAARRRVLKRRALIYSRRVKDALLAREGCHATHASFELLKAER